MSMYYTFYGTNDPKEFRYYDSVERDNEEIEVYTDTVGNTEMIQLSLSSVFLSGTGLSLLVNEITDYIEENKESLVPIEDFGEFSTFNYQLTDKDLLFIKSELLVSLNKKALSLSMVTESQLDDYIESINDLREAMRLINRVLEMDRAYYGLECG